MSNVMGKDNSVGYFSILIVRIVRDVHILKKRPKGKLFYIVYIFPSEATVDIPLNGVFKLLPTPHLRHCVSDNFLLTPIGILAIGIICQFIYIIPVYKCN